MTRQTSQKSQKQKKAKNNTRYVNGFLPRVVRVPLRLTLKRFLRKPKPGATTPNTKKMPPKCKLANAKDWMIQGKAPTNGNKVKPSSKPAAKPSPKTTAKKTPKSTPRKETKPERRSGLPEGVLRKFQGTLRKDEVIRNINGVSYVIKPKDSAFAGKKR